MTPEEATGYQLESKMLLSITTPIAVASALKYYFI